MDRFSLKPEIVFGSGAASVLENLKNERVFIVADPFIVSSGMISLVTNHLKACEISIFSDVIPDPPMEKVAAGIVAMNQFHPTMMIACGGGSAIDSAKGIFYYGKNALRQFIAIPTTSGTGSEVTKFAVFTQGSTGQKYPVVSDAMIPDMAILDVDFVKSVPSKVTADTGMDVLTHAIEAYVSTSANTLSDALAEKAVKLVFEYLLNSYKFSSDLPTGKKTYEVPTKGIKSLSDEKKTREAETMDSIGMKARQKMHEASVLAGMAFNEASLGLNHAIAHNLGGRLKISHGRMNAMLLCPVIWFNSEIEGYGQNTYSEAAKKYAQLAQLCGVSGTTPRGMIKGFTDKIKALMKSMDMPLTLKQAGISDAVIRQVEGDAVKGALQDACLKTNPRSADEKQMQDVIKKLKNIVC